MGPEVRQSVWSYYPAAFVRAFWSAWDWAVGQGLYLSILLAVCALIFTIARAMGRSRSWADAKGDVVHALADFISAGVAATCIGLFILFVIFLMRDPPTQLQKAREEIIRLGGVPDRPV